MLLALVLAFTPLPPEISGWGGGEDGADEAAEGPDLYGAVALTPDGTTFGYATNAPTPERAASMALQECGARASGCRIVERLDGQAVCGAIASPRVESGVPPHYSGLARRCSAKAGDEAQRLALEACEAAAGDGAYCQVVTVFCNGGVAPCAMSDAGAPRALRSAARNRCAAAPAG